MKDFLPSQVNELVDGLLKNFPKYSPAKIESSDNKDYVVAWYRNSGNKDKAITDDCLKRCIDSAFQHDFPNLAVEYNNSLRIIRKMNFLSKNVINYYEIGIFSQSDLDQYFNNLKKAVSNGILCYTAVQNYITENSYTFTVNDVTLGDLQDLLPNKSALTGLEEQEHLSSSTPPQTPPRPNRRSE